MMSPVVAALSAGRIASVASLSVANIAAPTELNSRVGSAGEWVLCYQTGAGTDSWTLYAFDAAGSSVSSPYRLAASGSGYWVAIAGLYCNSALNLLGLLTATAGLTTPAQITSTIVTGTPPLVVASTTNIPNLNASSLSGATFPSPGAIGGTTPGSGAFTTITATGTVKLATSVVASLPAAGTAGRLYFATNGRKNGEGGGAGTGVLVFDDGTAWRACDTGATVAA